jgi:hypothetical protein
MWLYEAEPLRTPESSFVCHFQSLLQTLRTHDDVNIAHRPKGVIGISIKGEYRALHQKKIDAMIGERLGKLTQVMAESEPLCRDGTAAVHGLLSKRSWAMLVETDLAELVTQERMEVWGRNPKQAGPVDLSGITPKLRNPARARMAKQLEKKFPLDNRIRAVLACCTLGRTT